VGWRRSTSRVGGSVGWQDAELSPGNLAVLVELSQNRRRLLGRMRRRRQREREGCVLVEGVRSVAEALDAGADPLFAVVSPALAASEAGRALGVRLEAGCETAHVDDSELRTLADTDHPQGALLVCREPSRDADLLPTQGRVLVLDAVQDPGNLGTLVRSAVAFGLDRVLCLDGTVDPWSPKAVRASAGNAFRIPIHMAAAEAVVAALDGERALVLVAAADGRPAREAFDTEESLTALVVGNEGAGVRDELRSVASATVAVPMAGPTESLNAGVAGSILMYEWTR
jgi:TrmH family RNA methyltransferase